MLTTMKMFTKVDKVIKVIKTNKTQHCFVGVDMRSGDTERDVSLDRSKKYSVMATVLYQGEIERIPIYSERDIRCLIFEKDQNGNINRTRFGKMVAYYTTSRSPDLYMNNTGCDLLCGMNCDDKNIESGVCGPIVLFALHGELDNEQMDYLQQIHKGMCQ